VFKAFFDRTKDWADLEEMQAAGTLDVEAVAVQYPDPGRRSRVYSWYGFDDDQAQHRDS